jgi:hypothetical protein
VKSQAPHPAARPSAPRIDPQDLERIKALLKKQDPSPLDSPGTISACPHCHGPMVTTNDLEEEIPTPRGLIVLTRLPGARCLQCHAQQFDAAALGIIERHRTDEVVADYETTVTKTSGATLGTYFKADLRRVLRLKGTERLRWTVLGHDRVLVDVERPPRGSPPKRGKNTNPNRI